MPDNEPQCETDEVLLPSMPGGQPYSESGIDLTLMHCMLALTPEERLLALQNTVQAILRMRDAASQQVRAANDAANAR